MTHFIGAYKKYADFSGRARRKEYWMFQLFYLLTVIVLVTIETITQIPGISLIFMLASLLPAIALTARRLHDINKSGWWQLVMLVPVIGPIVLLVFMVMDGTVGENRFGANPKPLPV